MEKPPFNKNEAGQENRDKLLEKVTFEIVEKDEETKEDIMNLLHQYPDQFVPGLFETSAEQDFENSDTMVARDDDKIAGCLMFDRQKNEFNWLAIDRTIKIPKSKVAKLLFESFYKKIPHGTSVHFFVNTKDASIPNQPSFSGRKFGAAMRLYRSMGLEIKEENRIENKFGPGAHAYKVEWEIK